MRGWLLQRGGAIALAVLVVYALLAPAHIVDTDNAELTTLGAIGGAAHPPGYPLYLLLLRAFAWLPGSPAHAAALATVLVAVALVLVLHAAARAWGASPAAASLACAVYAAGPFVLRMHTEAEVFALNGLIGAAILWLAAANGPARGLVRVGLLALVAGLGLANHHTCALLAPIGLYGAVRGARESGRWPLAIAVGLGGLVLGLAPYAYLFVTDDNMMSWPAPHSLGDLWTIVSRKEYGAASMGVAGTARGSAAAALGAFAAFTGRSWLWLPALGGLAILGARVARGPDRWAWGALAASWLLAGPVLTLVADAPSEGFGLFVVRRYQLLSLAVLAVPIAAAFDALVRRLGERDWPAHALAIAAFLGGTAIAAPRVQALHSPAVELAARNLLGSLPPSAVVLGEGDDLHTGVRYAQLVLGLRPDVTYIHLRAMGTPWYRARISAQGVPVGDARSTAALAQAILATGRPLFETSSHTRLPTYPWGFVRRVLPATSAPPALDDILALDKQLYSRFDLSAPHPSPDDELAADVYRRYAATWRELATSLAAAHRPDDAQAAAGVAAQLEPSP